MRDLATLIDAARLEVRARMDEATFPSREWFELNSLESELTRAAYKSERIERLHRSTTERAGGVSDSSEATP